MPLPYIYDRYNVEAYYTNPLSDVKPTIARMYNSLIKALNTHDHLPRYVVVIPDLDIVQSVNDQHFDCGAVDMIEDNINWLLKQIARILLARCDQLRNKKAGVVPDELPRVLWVKMLARPHTNDATLKKIWQLRRKFNSILTSILAVENYMHLISLESVNEYIHFDQFGQLTNTGQGQWWHELNDKIKHLD